MQLMTLDRFEQYLKERDLDVPRDWLEWLEKVGLCRPCIRVNRPVVGTGFRKYAGMNLGTEGLKEAYRGGLVTFPSIDNYLPWDSYQDEFQEKVFTLYHPYQMLEIADFMKWQGVRLSPEYVEAPKNVETVFDQLRKWNEGVVNALRRGRSDQVALIGFLMLLEQEFVSRAAKRRIVEMVKNTGGIEVAKRWHEYLAREGHTKDPLARWFPLTRLVRHSLRKQLRGRALLADDLYDMAEMVAYAIEDASGEKVPAPDDFVIRGSNWKKMLFGDNFDYNSNETRTKILDYYLKDRQILNTLILEGDTEEFAVEGLLQALQISPEQAGLELVNLQGYTNLDSREIRRKLVALKKARGNVVVMVDREADVGYAIQQYVANGLVAEGEYKIWDGDFEQENFGIERVLQEVNNALLANGLTVIGLREVEEGIERQQNLMYALKKLIGRKYRVGLETLLPKKTLAATILQPRFDEVENEYLDGGWKPKLPFERFLKESLFDKIRIYK